MYIYKTVFNTEQEGRETLFNKGVWKEEITEYGTEMVYINGTRAVVNIGKIVKTPAVYNSDLEEITPPVYYPGWAYDIMSTEWIDFGDNQVFPGESASHSFLGWPRNSEVPQPPPPPEEELIVE